MFCMAGDTIPLHHAVVATAGHAGAVDFQLDKMAEVAFW